jgi:hypothetical protein
VRKSRKKTEDFPERRRTVRLTVLSRINDPSSATRPAGRNDCNRDAMAGLDKSNNQSRTQRTDFA